VLEDLAADGCVSLLERLAEHPKASARLLSQLATHSHPDVRAAVTENSNTPKELVDVLARDESPDVRYIIAENARTPMHVLEMLCEDENPYVAHRARTTIGRLRAESVKPIPLYAGELRRLEQLG
jgi:hypothetical protein